MTIEYHCPVCRGVTSLPNEKEGTLAACSRCQLKFIAPAPGASVPPESASAPLFDSNATEVFDGAESSSFDRTAMTDSAVFDRNEMPDSSVFERPGLAKKDGYDPFKGTVPGFEDRDAFRTASGRFTPLRPSQLSEAGSPFEPFIPQDDNVLGDIPVPPALPPTPTAPPTPAPNPFSAPIPGLPSSDIPEPGEVTPTFGTALTENPALAAPNPFAAPVPEPGANNPRPHSSTLPPLQSSSGASPNPFAAPVAENKERQRPPASSRHEAQAPAAPNPFAAPVPESSKHKAPPKSPAAQFTPSIRSQSTAPQPPPAPAPKKEQEYSLLVVEGLAEQLFKFQQGSSYVVGRDVAAGIKIMSKSVSRRHARIETTGPTPVLIDLGSANGTIVNGTKVSRLVLRDGDLIKIGQVILRFQNES
ncbi:MAG: FHA domain-containing protein [Planctomycetota bacterium]|nr:FHA domain-containing protein [Planctomycetota bacterium]